VRLVQTRIAGGTWHGILQAGDSPPRIDLLRAGEVLGRARLAAAGAGHWAVAADIPAGCLHDGVQTFVLADAETGARLCAFSLVAGLPVGDDIRGEIDLLRAEVEMLKRALRRALREGGDDGAAGAGG